MKQLSSLLWICLCITALNLRVSAQTTLSRHVFSNGTTPWGSIGQSIAGVSQQKDSVELRVGFWYQGDTEVPAPKVGETVSITDISPNPSAVQTVFYISNPTAINQTISIVVFDAAGREVAISFKGEVPPGETAIRFQSSDVPTGTYFCRLLLGDRKQIMQFNVNK